MKSCLLFLILIALPVLADSQTLAKAEIIKKNYLGEDFVRLDGDHLWIATTEVTNLEWLEYLWWLRQHDMDAEYEKALPDSLIWLKSLNYPQPYLGHYFRHPSFQNYPVVGITQEQARAYCKWVTDRWNESVKIKRSPIEKVLIRLPSEKEWIMAAKGGLPSDAVYPWEGNTLRYSKGKRHRGELMANVIRDEADNKNISPSLNDKGFITTPVKSYWPNPLGVYNMAGNVSEWIEEENRMKGGSWNLPPYNARIDVKHIYDGDGQARADVGLRFVVEIIAVKPVCKEYKVTAKSIEKMLAIGKASYSRDTLPNANAIYPAYFETPNSLYWQFLKANPDPVNRIRHELWKEWFRYDFYQEYGKHPFYEMHPVVNISFEAANNFCSWLSDHYNKLDGRRFNKVRFRLPTKKEWMKMANTCEYCIYPWRGIYLRNWKGCYLANFCPLEEQYYCSDGKDSLGNQRYFYNYPNGDHSISRAADGFIIPAAIDSYWPNDHGLYNLGGNVAEMIDQKGVSKGGSWNSSQDFLRIDARETYSSPSATLGFRFVMEVIEK